ncbi:abortive phage resistance protein [Pantoea vagans]|uniref:AbiTii domain-containing protein n=1 Tax=Pantoea vagans TaxID=470934 RepID=UPI000BAC9496|nr:abortive phage resistance protein [Pantoea vagans]PAW34404.1 abortive phage resistance protein [Pantoea vagans]
MNNSPVLKLQDMASSSSTDVEELLSRAKMISVKLGLKDISEWLDYEINAYPDYASLPDYRIVRDVPIRGFNPYRGWIPYQFTNADNNDIYQSLTTMHMTNPVSMLVEYAKSEDSLYCDIPQFMTEFLQKSSGCDFRMAWCLSPSVITKILSNTRSRILDWALLLEEKGILGEGLLFSHEEKMEAKGMTINNINNFHGNVNNAGAIGAGNSGDISQKNIINAGDFNSLEKQLKDWGIPKEDISTLHQAIKNSPTPTSADSLGSNVGKWLGDMVGKAYSGSLKIAASAAPALLTNAICHYYNIPV